ncbi:MAG TPA: DUF72 domain-containing protein [Planctomycetota bacterium]|nr:DUF72 domain-containing protein [Planctomycetota bacterium]HRR82602.1 DUF72 domain-containing protein [Planctomycetota bacterium]HRT94804.1 DUF72 domain-containing protein [Planctomycetota bacterium]
MIAVGTSGYQYSDWKGPFYPDSVPRGGELEYYAEHFNTVELNFTYYRMPSFRTIEAMVKKTPPGFTFWVKANEATTHQQDRSVAAAFNEAMAPAREAGRLAGVLCQFPYSFRNTERHRAYLAALAEDFPHDPLVVEFRNAQWANQAVFSFLRAHRLGFCCVDEPALPGLMPRIAVATAPTAYVRFHSRDASKWYEGGGKERYNYRYRRDELEEWLPKIQQLDAEAENVYIFFNNCHAGHAAVNAEEFKKLLADLGVIR